MESKIQLIAPNQNRQERGSLEGPSAHSRLLVGVHPVEELFVLWDAYKHSDFAYSKNVQVRGELLWDAKTFGIATTTRRLASGTETVLAATRQKLYEAIVRRLRPDDI